MHMLETQRERYADDGKPPLDWERYLELGPALSGLDPEAREEALTTRELDGDTWSRAEGYWTLTLALDVERSRTDRAEAYGVACAAAWAARGVSGQPPEDTLPEAGAVLPASPPARPAELSPPVPAAVPVPELATPTFLRVQPPVHVEGRPPAVPARVTLDPASAGRQTVALAPFAVPAPAMPFVPGPAAWSPSPPAPAVRPNAGGETMDLGDLLRFAPPVPAPPLRSSTGTVDIDLEAVARILAEAGRPKR